MLDTTEAPVFPMQRDVARCPFDPPAPLAEWRREGGAQGGCGSGTVVSRGS